MIRRAKISEIADILAITTACATKMKQQGIYQWNEHYPSRSAFENDIARNELFVLEMDGFIIGAVTLSTFMDAEYVPVQWVAPSPDNLYVHRLFVAPEHQGKGHAQALMAFAEDYAVKEGFVSVRLDTFSQNKRNQKFYETRGYKRLGDIYLPELSAHPFHCYELIL